jgi:hypothetical protein
MQGSTVLAVIKNQNCKASELNLDITDKRGIETENGVVYFVEQNLKVLSAYTNGVLHWKADVIANCGEPKAGKSEIRYIKLDGDKINIILGKHKYANIIITSGKVKCLDAD